MSLIQTAFADITFFDVAMSLIIVGLIERLMLWLPSQGDS